MSASPLRRLLETFVAPPTTPAPRRPAVERAPVVLGPAAGLLCPPRVAGPLGAALALALARGTDAAPLLLCWAGASDATGAVAPACPRARRLASVLRARELSAQASGRLVRLALARESEEAAGQARRAAAATSGAIVLALAAPRDPTLDELLTTFDLLVVAATGDVNEPLVRTAVRSAQALGPPVVTCQASPGPLSRAVAVGGLRASTGLRVALRPALEALR